MQSTNMPKGFKGRLAELVRESDLDYRPLAAAIGISQASLSKYTRGDAEPGLGALVKLATYFKVSTDYLAGLTDVRSPSPDLQGAAEYTGLHEAAVEVLHHEQSEARKELWLAEKDKWGGIFDKFGDMMHLHSLDALSWIVANDDIWITIRCMYAALIANLDDDGSGKDINDAYKLSFEKGAKTTLRGVALGEFYRQTAKKGFGFIFDGFIKDFSDGVRRLMDGDENAED